jgi:hypothetical protein
MAGVFLSHSTRDKPFVERLAIDLVNRGFPVWLDTWELGTGDSVEGRILGGIGESDYLLVVLSPNSVGSDWVEREVGAGFELEERTGRTVVLPIRIAPCELPPAIAGRVHADFTGSYLEALERLAAELERRGLAAADEPPERALVPVVFRKGIYLDGVTLARRVEALRPRLPEGFEFRPEQFVIAPER